MGSDSHCDSEPPKETFSDQTNNIEKTQEADGRDLPDTCQLIEPKSDLFWSTDSQWAQEQGFRRIQSKQKRQ